MKNTILKYANRSYGFITGVVVTISTIVLFVTGVVLYAVGKSKGKEEAKTEEEKE